MSQSGFNRALAAGLAVDLQRARSPRPESGKLSRYRELELKLAAGSRTFVLEGGAWKPRSEPSPGGEPWVRLELRGRARFAKAETESGEELREELRSLGYLQ